MSSTTAPTSAFRCAVRIRPKLGREVASPECVFVSANNTVLVEDPETGDGREFVSVPLLVPPDSTQEQTAEKLQVESLVDAVLNGYHGTVIAYGQTGSGKTHTLLGGSNQLDGLVPRCIEQLYKKRNRDNGTHRRVRASFLEISNAVGLVNEVVTDLLDTSKAGLQVRHSETGVPFVSDLTCVECDTVEDALCVLQEGAKYRRTSKTELNERSSRSHSIFTLYVEGGSRYAKFQFVDLAGSERIKTSKAQGEQLLEAQTINKSLFTLGQVILALSSANGLSKNGQHIPYRNSRLTELLSDAFGGNSYTVFITCISPVFAEESIHSLSYVTRALNIENRPRKNTLLNNNASPQRQRNNHPQGGSSSSSSASGISKLQLEQLRNEITADLLRAQPLSSSASSSATGTMSSLVQPGHFAGGAPLLGGGAAGGAINYSSALTAAVAGTPSLPSGQQGRMLRLLQANMFSIMSGMLQDAAAKLASGEAEPSWPGTAREPHQGATAAAQLIPPRAPALGHPVPATAGGLVSHVVGGVDDGGGDANSVSQGAGGSKRDDSHSLVEQAMASVREALPPEPHEAGLNDTNLGLKNNDLRDLSLLNGALHDAPAAVEADEEPYEAVVRRIREEHSRLKAGVAQLQQAVPEGTPAERGSAAGSSASASSSSSSAFAESSNGGGGRIKQTPAAPPGGGIMRPTSFSSAKQSQRAASHPVSGNGPTASSSASSAAPKKSRRSTSKPTLARLPLREERAESPVVVATAQKVRLGGPPPLPDEIEARPYIAGKAGLDGVGTPCSSNVEQGKRAALKAVEQQGEKRRARRDSTPSLPAIDTARSGRPSARNASKESSSSHTSKNSYSGYARRRQTRAGDKTAPREQQDVVKWTKSRPGGRDTENKSGGAAAPLPPPSEKPRRGVRPTSQGGRPASGNALGLDVGETSAAAGVVNAPSTSATTIEDGTIVPPLFADAAESILGGVDASRATDVGAAHLLAGAGTPGCPGGFPMQSVTEADPAAERGSAASTLVLERAVLSGAANAETRHDRQLSYSPQDDVASSARSPKAFSSTPPKLSSSDVEVRDAGQGGQLPVDSAGRHTFSRQAGGSSARKSFFHGLQLNPGDTLSAKVNHSTSGEQQMSTSGIDNSGHHPARDELEAAPVLASSSSIASPQRSKTSSDLQDPVSHFSIPEESPPRLSSPPEGSPPDGSQLRRKHNPAPAGGLQPPSLVLTGTSSATSSKAGIGQTAGRILSHLVKQGGKIIGGCKQKREEELSQMLLASPFIADDAGALATNKKQHFVAGGIVAPPAPRTPNLEGVLASYKAPRLSSFYSPTRASLESQWRGSEPRSALLNKAALPGTLASPNIAAGLRMQGPPQPAASLTSASSISTRNNPSNTRAVTTLAAQLLRQRGIVDSQNRVIAPTQRPPAAVTRTSGGAFSGVYVSPKTGRSSLVSFQDEENHPYLVSDEVLQVASSRVPQKSRGPQIISSSVDASSSMLRGSVAKEDVAQQHHSPGGVKTSARSVFEAYPEFSDVELYSPTASPPPGPGARDAALPTHTTEGLSAGIGVVQRPSASASSSGAVHSKMGDQQRFSDGKATSLAEVGLKDLKAMEEYISGLERRLNTALDTARTPKSALPPEIAVN
ncbi:unnamed protein product [Amoebophrya sp. A25]|nr:unnamed protein product [Amoebophrya sp. A25]|eukprot:GSA25T00011638001.1